MTLEDFESQVLSACIQSEIVVGVSTVASGVTWVRFRAHLVDGMFADAFYNEATGKTAFALIRNDRRIFGADNTGGWHWHPFDRPDEHDRVDKAVTFAVFLRLVEQRTESKT